MKLDNNKGAALVEMAIILPLLIYIVLCIFDFGWLMFVKNTLTNAAREGARLAAVTKPINNDTVGTRVKKCIPIDFNAKNLTITTVPSEPSIGDTVTVTVTLFIEPITGKIFSLDGLILKGEKMGRTLTAEATMRYEL